MATTLQVDDRLIDQAMRLGRHRTKRAAAAEALANYVRHLQQQEIVDHFGTFDIDPTYDYKAQRQKA